MCGIFGFCTAEFNETSAGDIEKYLANLFCLSEARGKEAAGLALWTGNEISIYKEATAASRMVRGKNYKNFIRQRLLSCQSGSPFSAIGHARLVTNGIQGIGINNQPISRSGLVAVHNGIVTNCENVWKNHPELKREREVDTEVILALMRKYQKTPDDIYNALNTTFTEIEGNSTIALLCNDRPGITLATNVGSLYYALSPDRSMFFFASEKLILDYFFSGNSIPADLAVQYKNNISHFAAGKAAAVEPLKEEIKIHEFAIGNHKQEFPEVGINTTETKIYDLSLWAEEARKNIRRCTRCILPETFPFINFDEHGVCNYCRDYKKMEVLPREDGNKELEKYRRKNNTAECLFMLSGGRDSCMGLHLAVEEFGLKPIAYTYDWGMVTDIARRNASRLTGKLGVEHIIVSADIPWKRENIRKNIVAWLKRPELGMVPLFMAGDKQYFYYANKIARVNNLPFTVVSECPIEQSLFKAGFCGVDINKDNRNYNIGILRKLKLIKYYGIEHLKNPGYLNSTMWDNAFAFYSSYFMSHNYFFLFRYHRWNEQEINKTLVDKYNWEIDPEASTTWRIGDGTAAFYNYIYYTVAGFTENDTLRSNQVREGIMTREEALKQVELDNRPRWNSMEWYASVVGFNLNTALQRINNIPKLYCN